MMKKQCMLLCLTTAVLTAIPSCGGAGVSGETSGTTETELQTTISADESEEIPSYELPDADLGGFTFRMLHDVLGWGTYTHEYLTFEEENGDILTDAIYRRNRSVEERYNITVTEIITSSVTADITRSIMAGDDDYDVGMVVYGWAKGTDMLLDFHTVPNIDLSMPWWDQNAVKQLSVDGKVTNALSDLMVTHRDGTVAMFFNKKLAENYDLGDFYGMVRSGTWTLDAFNSAARAVNDDLDGNGAYTDKDLYGYCGTRSNTIIYQMLGAGIRFTENNADDIPCFTIGDASSVDRIGYVVDSLYGGSFLYCPSINKNEGSDGDQSIFRVFAEDRALFMSHGIGSAYKLRDMESDFGVLPAPKYDEAQESYYNTADAGKYLVIPKTAPDPARTGLILEALSYEGYRSVIPAYYDTMLKNKLMRDEASIEMLDTYIFPNVLQKGFCYAPVQTMLESIKDTTKIASTIEKKKGSIEKEIGKIIESMTE